MAWDKIEIIVEKYFRGETSIAEEKELQNYFSSSNVCAAFRTIQTSFFLFCISKEQKSERKFSLLSGNKKKPWLFVAASMVVLLGIGTYGYFNYENASQSQDLGTYDDPEIAFRETQKALSMLSNQVNLGIQSVHYIQEFDNSKKMIFKQ